MFLQKIKIGIIFFLIISNSTSLASNRTDEKDGWIENWPQAIVIPERAPFFITLSVNGGVSKSNGPNQTFFLQYDIQKTYSAFNPYYGIIEGEVFAGGKKELTAHTKLQLGIAGLVSSKAKFKGGIWEDANATFYNYDYTFYAYHSHVAVKGKIISDMNMSVLPYFSASAGVGFNNAQNFSITPLIYEEVAAPNFTNDMQTSFVYTAGFGFQFPVYKIQIGIGYEFSDWGNVQLGRAPGQTSGKGLTMPHLYTNLLQLSASFNG